MEKREKVMLELEKLRQRVDEFNDYGELDMMQQYVNDVRTVQKRLVDVSESIGWINKVHHCCCCCFLFKDTNLAALYVYNPVASNMIVMYALNLIYMFKLFELCMQAQL